MFACNISICEIKERRQESYTLCIISAYYIVNAQYTLAYSVFHLFNKYLSCTKQVLGKFLGLRDASANKIKSFPSWT